MIRFRVEHAAINRNLKQTQFDWRDRHSLLQHARKKRSALLYSRRLLLLFTPNLLPLFRYKRESNVPYSCKDALQLQC